MKCLVIGFLIFSGFVSVQSDVVDAKSEGGKSFVLAPTPDDSRAYVLITRSARYSFTIPRGWSVAARPETREVMLASTESFTSIVIRFEDEMGQRRLAHEAQTWLAPLQESLNASLVGEAEVAALRRRATGYDLEWTEGGSVARSGRFARVNLDKGYLDFHLRCERDIFGKALPVLTHLMSSVRTAAASDLVRVRSTASE